MSLDCWVSGSIRSHQHDHRLLLSSLQIDAFVLEATAAGCQLMCPAKVVAYLPGATALLTMSAWMAALDKHLLTNSSQWGTSGAHQAKGRWPATSSLVMPDTSILHMQAYAPPLEQVASASIKVCHAA